jgi:hypothetical protein
MSIIIFFNLLQLLKPFSLAAKPLLTHTHVVLLLSFREDFVLFSLRVFALVDVALIFRIFLQAPLQVFSPLIDEIDAVMYDGLELLRFKLVDIRGQGLFLYIHRRI